MPLTYHAVRMAHARSALLAGLRRWGSLLAAGTAVAAAASNAPLAVAAALLAACGLPIWDLAQAWASPAGPGASTVLRTLAVLPAMAAAACLPVLPTRHLWWPARWAEHERAWPLTRQARRASDAALLPWLVGPALLLVAAGLAVLGLRSQGTASAPGGSPALAQAATLVLLWLMLAGLSAALAWGWMQAVRGWTQRAARGLADARAAGAAGPRAPLAWRPPQPRHWAWALVVQPLRHRMARSTARVLALGCLTTPALAAGPMLDARATGPCLALLALAALVCTGLLVQRSQLEWAGLRQACRAWPLAPRRLARALRLLAVLPMGLGVATAALVLPTLGARPAWALSYALALVLACVVESAPGQADAPDGRTAPAPRDASARAARWLLWLAALGALAWEVAP